jgi:hypothetical protein
MEQEEDKPHHTYNLSFHTPGPPGNRLGSLLRNLFIPWSSEFYAFAFMR